MKNRLVTLLFCTILSAMFLSVTPASAHNRNFRQFCDQLLALPSASAAIPFEISIYRHQSNVKIAVIESRPDRGPKQVYANIEFDIAGKSRQTLTIRELKTRTVKIDKDFTALLFSRALDLHPNTTEIQDELIERDMVTFVDALSMNFTTEEAIVLTDGYKRLAAMGFPRVSFVKMSLEDNDAFGALIVQFGVERP